MRAVGRDTWVGRHLWVVRHPWGGALSLGGVRRGLRADATATGSSRVPEVGWVDHVCGGNTWLARIRGLGARTAGYWP